MPDMRATLGTAQVCAAALAGDRPEGRGAEGEGIVFTTQWTTVSERTLVNMATEQSREGPFPADMDIGLLGDAVWAKGVSCPLIAKSKALVGIGFGAEKERGFRIRQTGSEVERTKRAAGRSTESCHGLQKWLGKIPVE